MKRVCSYCKKEIGPVLSEHIEGVITHGVCFECLTWLRKSIGQTLRDYLNTFYFPVLLVDSNVDVKIANNDAMDFLGKNLFEIEGYRGGDAVECEYARFPEGCGGTVHCKACAIRNTVTETQKTGKSFKDVPAIQNIYSSGKVVKTHLKISTEKFNDLVLLRIDPA